MSVLLECKKVKRTGFIPAFLAGGFLAAAVPMINMAVRSDMYVGGHGTPLQILMKANWQMMMMLNVLLVVVGNCILYHTEFADNAMLKMETLPIRESTIFFWKGMLTMVMYAFALAIEAGAMAFCVYHWFGIENGFGEELLKEFGYAFLLMLPSMLLSLLISEAFKNMWVSLGIGVICVFIATMLQTGGFVFSLFPFAMPFQMLAANTARALDFICAAMIELAALGFAELIFIKVRRSFE